MSNGVNALNPTGWTPEREAVFLEKLANSGSVMAASRAVKIARSVAYFHRDQDEGFAARWASALKVSVARLEHAALRRAVTGIDEPVFQGGELVGYKRKYSDTLLAFLLQAHDERYRRNRDDGPMVTINVVNVITDANEQARARAQSLRGPQQPVIIDGTTTPK